MMARPTIPVDEQLLEDLTKLHLSDKVIADILGISADTLHRRYAEQMDHWRSVSVGKIAEVLFDEGVNRREPWALKALAQKHLDYSDRVKSDADNRNVNLNADVKIEKEDIKELIKSARGIK